MNRYRGDDMDKMQQEAMRRMQEMQSRGKQQPAEQQNKTNNEKATEKPPTPIKQQKQEIKPHKSFMDTLLQDKERSLILLLLLLLSTEKCDTGLVLALIYLLI